MTELVMHPGLVLLVGALVLPLTAGHGRSLLQLALPLLSLWWVWQLPDGMVWQLHYLDYQLTPLQVDALSRLFATIFSLAAFAGGLFALQQSSRLEITAAYVYAGAAVSVVLAGDLITVFVFWEIMALASTLVLWSTTTAASGRSAHRYLIVHLFGGVLLLAGIAGQVQQTGDLAFTAMRADSVATWLILAGFLLNAGAPPLSAWLPDAYPEASWSGTVFLSAFTTKTAVYTLIRGFPGEPLLIWIGLFMVFYGIVFALLENDMRRILAYSIVNQVGFMVAGIGIGTELALNGAAAHAFTHIIYKALLLMSAGAALMQTGRSKCSELGGLFHSMPLTTLCASIGALASSSFPLTSGFISKSMISQSAADEHLLWVWLLMTAASAGVFLHAGIIFPWFVFFQKDSGLRPSEPPWSMRWAMILLSALCIGLGLWPDWLYQHLPYTVSYEPYTGPHVVAQLQLLLFSGLAFFVFLPYLKRTLTITLDTDWFWRRGLPMLTQCGLVLGSQVTALLTAIGTHLRDAMRAGITQHLGDTGTQAKTWSLAAMGLVVMVMLIVQLLILLL